MHQVPKKKLKHAISGWLDKRSFRLFFAWPGKSFPGLIW